MSLKNKTKLKVALISVMGLGLALFAHSKTSITETENSSSKVVEKSSVMVPQVVTGKVNKTLEEFSITARNGVSYHVADPSHLLDKLAKKRGNTHPLYQLDNVRIKGLISPAGNYGHMGYYQYQLTVVDVSDI